MRLLGADCWIPGPAAGAVSLRGAVSTETPVLPQQDLRCSSGNLPRQLADLSALTPVVGHGAVES